MNNMGETLKKSEINEKGKIILVTLLTILPIAGIILLLFLKLYALGAVLFVLGVAIGVYIIYKKSKEEERLLFSSLFTLAIFTSTLLSISNKMWGIFAFLFLVVVLLWRFGTDSEWIKIGASYVLLLILILGEAIAMLSMLS